MNNGDMSTCINKERYLMNILYTLKRLLSVGRALNAFFQVHENPILMMHKFAMNWARHLNCILNTESNLINAHFNILKKKPKPPNKKRKKIKNPGTLREQKMSKMIA